MLLLLTQCPPDRSLRRRAHFCFVYLNVFWASWLIVEYYKACTLLGC